MANESNVLTRNLRKRSKKRVKKSTALELPTPREVGAYLSKMVQIRTNLSMNIVVRSLVKTKLIDVVSPQNFSVCYSSCYY
uniref:Uncharacterized protein n=1 Tax=Trichobilharzia regenti TaxID=157069 RepID=A0AA85JC14_TRIRE|nr:unnamed protein product [Trichobilharzia regenti]